MEKKSMDRFYTEVSVQKDGNVFHIHLDGRAVKTPAKNILVLPTEKLAKAVAKEWDDQKEKIVAADMPLTRLANTALDRVRENLLHVVDEVSAFGGSDLICYRASSPEDLINRQKKYWNPFVVWASKELGVDLNITEGVMPIGQNQDALSLLKSHVMQGDEFYLTGLHDVVSMTGSLVIGLAISKGFVTPEEGWIASNVDNDYQKEQWGEDAEAAAKMQEKHDMLLSAAHYLETLKV